MLKKLFTTPRSLGWFVVVVVGLIVLGVVGGLQLFPRLNAGQDVLDGARPAFTEERVAGARAGITMIDYAANMADPIIDAEGGAAAEVIPLVDLVAGATGLEQAEVLAAIEENFPHTYHLLLALPLDGVSAEIPGLLTFVADNSELADSDAVLAAIADTTPNLAQAIVNLAVVTEDWRNIPGTEDLTRFDGSNVSSMPDVRSYFGTDVVPAVRAVAEDYRKLDTTFPPLDVFPPLLVVVGVLVIVYGADLLFITRVIAPDD